MRLFSASVMAAMLLAGCNDSPQKQVVPQKAETETVETVQPEATAQANVTAPSEAASPQTAAVVEDSPAVLYQRCAACHGNHAEKSALNQSAVIGEWDSKRIAASILGYQEGTYGGAMKTLMQNQVKNLSPVQVQALSEYIANLYVKTH